MTGKTRRASTRHEAERELHRFVTDLTLRHGLTPAEVVLALTEAIRLVAFACIKVQNLGHPAPAPPPPEDAAHGR